MLSTGDGAPRRENSVVYARTRVMLVFATSLGSVLGALLTVALLAIALLGMASGIAGYAGLVEVDSGIEPTAAVLAACIRGVELLFLAPLPFLLPLSLGRYIRDSKEDSDDRQSKADLLSMKALTTGLLIAILASDVVGRALSHGGLHYEAAVSSSLVIAVLGAYFFGLERQALHVKSEPPIGELRAPKSEQGGAPPAT